MHNMALGLRTDRGESDNGKGREGRLESNHVRDDLKGGWEVMT
jgi:hypothetical protein